MTVKKRKVKLTKCDQCGALTHDMEKHQASLGTNKPHEIIQTTFSSPFILHHQLYTQNIITIPLETMRLYSGFYSDYILLNPSTMRECGIIIGSQCIIITRGGRERRIVTAFADLDHISLLGVGVPIDFEVSGPVVVGAVEGKATNSSSLKIKNINGKEINDKVQDHIKSRLVDTCFIPGDTKSFWYFGETHDVELTDSTEGPPNDDIASTVVPSSDTTAESYAEFISACSELESTAVRQDVPHNGNSETIGPIAAILDEFLLELTDLFPFPDTILRVTQQTVIEFPPVGRKEANPSEMPIVGGMADLIDKLAGIINHFHSSPQFGASPGLILHGPPGCGKRTLISAVSHLLDVPLHVFSCMDVFLDRTKFVDKIGNFLREVGPAKCLILFKDADLLAPRSAETDSQRTLKYKFMSVVNDIITDKQLFVLLSTSRPELVDLQLRRQVECEIEIPTPNSAERHKIFTACLSRFPLDCPYTDISYAADCACGYVAGDIMAVCKLAFRNYASGGPFDLAAALRDVRPSSMKELTLDVPKIRWGDIGGLDTVKGAVRQLVEWPVVHPEAFSRLGIKPPRGILVYGPPGCSKTMIAQAIATESHFNFLSVKGSELLSKYVGESERMVRELFRKARSVAPTVVFFDEIDALAPNRGNHSVTDRVLAQLLTELDGVESLRQVVFVAATNRPDMIDQALLRPGRVDRLIYVSLPDEDSRRKILDLQLRPKPLARDVLISDLAKSTEGYSGAEIVALCQEAAMEALTENIQAKCTEKRHFTSALDKIRPRTDHKMLDIYRSFSESNSAGNMELFQPAEDSETREAVPAGHNYFKFFFAAAATGSLVGCAIYMFFKLK